MKVTFLGQGFNNEIDSSVAQSLINAFANKSYHTFKCLVAFASQAGVTGLTDHIIQSKNHISNHRIIIGVDQNATSKEALESLLEWDIETFVFYTTQRNIFHPKIYIFEGEEDILIIIGSNNLTQMGLVQNIEGAVELTFVKKDSDENLLSQITQYFHPLLTGAHPNLKALTLDVIEELLSGGIIDTEAQRRSLYHKDVPDEISNSDADIVDSINIKEHFPVIPLQKIPKGFNPKRSTRRSIGVKTVAAVAGNSPVVIRNSNWTYTDNSPVLIVEIGGPSRWKQISFAKANFQTFFELPTNVGTSGQLNLKYLEHDGTIENGIESCISARVKESRNFNLEPLKVRETTANYDTTNRPVIFFIKINSNNFIYHLEMSGSSLYTELKQMLPSTTGLSRLVTTVQDLRVNCQSINL